MRCKTLFSRSLALNLGDVLDPRLRFLLHKKIGVLKLKFNGWYLE